MKDFESFFDFYNVLEQIIISRSKIAFYIHKNSYLDKYCKSKPFSIEDKARALEIKIISDLLPSRKEWSRPKKHINRKTFDSTMELNQQSIRNRVYHIHRLFITGQNNFLETPIWYQNLRKFIFNLKIKVFQSEHFSLVKPTVFPARKPPYKKEEKERRPIAKFFVEDKIVLSLTNKYLTQLFDNVFLDCSFAFRSKNSYMKGPTYHDAVELLKKFRIKHLDSPLYVAECDIKKFFDCVDHEVVVQKYNNAKEALSKQGVNIHQSAEMVFKGYLDCYSFSDSVFPLNTNIHFWHAANDFNGQFEWTVELIERFNAGDLALKRIGIPQGGALSGLMVNLLMHDLDDVVTNLASWNNDYIYLRYCDDMVIVHKSAKECKALFNDYFQNLSNLNLIPHAPPELKPKYSRMFWGKNIKSRDVYLWSIKKSDLHPHSPWVSFLGYMVHENGDLKIRKKSIEKQTTKHNSELLKVIKRLDKHTNEELINQELSIRKSFSSRLAAMAVGNIDIGTYKNTPLTMCWGAGFKLIENNKYTRHQLRHLDFTRQRALSKLKFYFEKRAIPNVKEEEKEDLPDLLEAGFPHSFFSILERPKF
ncbi:reverse transcriptase domain-containing protein [Daejeonella lutea]|uniref:Reverse transcriptase (RNA-dependent DNA polymerase) n=1 Tax=Daejeonella lutea TaxID=572036 RepID=A0A1T4ZWT2_9SPHI|nr:reverse transcriptase domain-containing protein [Daejeonella lutea]SKB27055.1 Reverse transcriptase (RNA-dependent DNA polymerase) [Daejeonella lutea]